MKKLFFNYSFAILSLLGLGFLSSCGEEEGVTPTLKVEFVEQAGYVSKDTSLTPGASFKIKWKAVKGSKDMSTLTLQEGNSTVGGFPKTLSGSEKDSYTDEITLTASNNVGEYNYKITVTDKDNMTTSAQVKVTVAADITTSNVTLLGNVKSSEPSFYSTSNHTAYKIAAAKTNSSKIDIVFGTGTAAGNHYYIGSPQDASVIATYGSITDGINGWATKNVTTFKTTAITAVQFDAINTGAVILSSYNSGTDPAAGTTRVQDAETQVGDVFAFKTAGNKYGLAKVTERTGTNPGSSDNVASIKIVVKVQQ